MRDIVTEWAGAGGHTFRLRGGAAPWRLADGGIRLFAENGGELRDGGVLYGQSTLLGATIPGDGLEPPYAFGFVLRPQPWPSPIGDGDWYVFSNTEASRHRWEDPVGGSNPGRVGTGVYPSDIDPESADAMKGYCTLRLGHEYGVNNDAPGLSVLFVNKDSGLISEQMDVTPTPLTFYAVLVEVQSNGVPRIWVNGALVATGSAVFGANLKHMTLLGIRLANNQFSAAGDIRAVVAASLLDYTVGDLNSILASFVPAWWYDPLVAQLGSAYMLAPEFAGGGSASSSTLETGTLPTGLSVAADGTISGTPSEGGWFKDLRVSGTLGGNPVVSEPFDLYVNVVTG